MLIRGPRLSDAKVGNTDNFKVFMGQHEIEQTNNYKYLGIIMDDKMDWMEAANQKIVLKVIYCVWSPQ